MKNSRKSKYFSADEVVISLAKKKDVKIDNDTKIIEVLKRTSERKTHDLGNGSWGKIDFLTNHCGYILSKVDRFTTKN